MGAMTSQITSLTIVYSTVYSDADQSKHQSSASLAFVWGIHRGPVNSPHKWPVTRKMFPFDDVIMHCILNTWRLKQNGRHFVHNVFNFIILNENCRNLILIPLQLVSNCPINNMPALAHMIALVFLFVCLWFFVCLFVFCLLFFPDILVVWVNLRLDGHSFRTWLQHT